MGGRLRIDVDDDGPGIAPAERERVFDRFHRSDAARARAAGGSGLGLAISREIVAAHGGRIWVEELAARRRPPQPRAAAASRPKIRDLSPNP